MVGEKKKIEAKLETLEPSAGGPQLWLTGWLTISSHATLPARRTLRSFTVSRELKNRVQRYDAPQRRTVRWFSLCGVIGLS